MIAAFGSGNLDRFCRTEKLPRPGKMALPASMADPAMAGVGGPASLACTRAGSQSSRLDAREPGAALAAR